MSSLNLNRCALSFCVAAILLAACSQASSLPQSNVAVPSLRVEQLAATNSNAASVKMASGPLKGEIFQAKHVHIRCVNPKDSDASAHTSGHATGPYSGTFDLGASWAWTCCNHGVGSEGFGGKFRIFSGSQTIRGTLKSVLDRQKSRCRSFDDIAIFYQEYIGGRRVGGGLADVDVTRKDLTVIFK